MADTDKELKLPGRILTAKPGPVYVRPEIKSKTGDYSDTHHRREDFKAEVIAVNEDLKQIGGVGEDPNYYGIIMTGSGTKVMATAAQIAQGNYILVLSVGEFGEKWREELAETFCHDYLQIKEGEPNPYFLKFPEGQAVDLEKLAERLREHPEITAVTVTINETSTGVMNPLREISEIVKREYNKLLFADAVSIFGGYPINVGELGIDLLAISPQKSLGIPAGIGLGIVSQEAYERAKKATGFGVDGNLAKTIKSMEKGNTLSTPAVGQIVAAYAQLHYILNEQGLDARYEHHRGLMAVAEAFLVSMREYGFDYFVENPAIRSPTVLAVRVPASVDIKAIHDAMRRKPFRFTDRNGDVLETFDGIDRDSGYEKLNKRLANRGENYRVMRIAAMGDLPVGYLKEILGYERQLMLDVLKKGGANG